MAYSWPGPMPPARRPRTLTLIRCVQCGAPLRYTKAKGQPRQEDHEQGCRSFITAVRVMQYADELKRAASGSDQRSWPSTRRRRKYLRANAKKLSVAACESDPVAAIRTLGDLYQAQCQGRPESAKAAELTHMAEMLMRACRQLARGQYPAPVIQGRR